MIYLILFLIIIIFVYACCVMADRADDQSEAYWRSL